MSFVRTSSKENPRQSWPRVQSTSRCMLELTGWDRVLLDKPFVTMFQLHQIAWSTSIISTDLPLACSLADATCAIAVVSNTFDWQTSSTSQPATPMMSQECWKQNWTGNTSSTNDTAFQQLFSSRDAQPLLCLFGRWLCLVSMFQYPVVQVV